MYQTKISKSSLRSTLLLGAASAAAFGIAAPASAADEVTTVVVTGSRIPQQGLYSSSPVTAVGTQEMKFEGTTNVENLLNNLPSVFADFGQTASNGSTGQATVDLRGLGSKRTLVLVDGTRLMPSDTANPVADLNQIPSALVDHVEVLTGGASAVYGSDAEAGVVNFIMRHDFEGLELDGTYSIDNAANGDKNLEALQDTFSFPHAPHDWWGGRDADATMILGVNTANGKGNITAYLGYRNIAPVLESKRDFSACSISIRRHANGHVCAGSANKDAWISLDDLYAYYYGASTNYFFYQQGNGTAGSGNFVPFTGAGDQRFNFGALNYLQRPDERYSGGFFAHYEVTPQMDVYTDFMFSDDHTLAQIAPSGAFLGNYFNMNCDNPLMTAQERHLLCSQNPQQLALGNPCTPVGDTGNCNLTPGFANIAVGRRDIEGGNRIDDLRHTAYRMKVGAKGDLGDGWGYDIYGQYGLTLYSENYQNEWSKQRFANALNVSPITGNCVSADLGIDRACVPLDVFNGFNSTNPNFANALQYVKAQGFKEGWTQEQIVSGSVNGDLGAWGVQSPWAKSPVGVALGAEYRDERVLLNTSRDFQTGDLYGQGAKTLPIPKSGFNVVEGFGEIRVPLVQGQPFFEDLSINAGARYSSYHVNGGAIPALGVIGGDNSFTVSSYKYGAEWQIVDDAKVRASFQRAVRAPNVVELFAPANVGLFGGNDPCAGASGVVLTNCNDGGQFSHVAHAATPITGNALSCPASQCNARFSGNAALRPEISDTRSVGVVLTPTFFDGFTATVDYFEIQINKFLQAPNQNAVLGACFGAGSTAQSQAIACPLVFRDPGTHSIHTTIGFVDATTRNTGAETTRGFDFEANYSFDLDAVGLPTWGSLSANFVGTKLESLKTTPLSGANSLAYDCAGFYGLLCGTPSPEWRHKLRVTWTSPWDVDISLDWRHLSSVKLDINDLNVPLFAGQCGVNSSPCPNKTDAVLKAFDYFDLSGTWNVTEGVELRAGVNNMFDVSPPIVDTNRQGLSSPPFGNGNTFPQVYDSLGRTIFVGGTIKY